MFDSAETDNDTLGGRIWRARSAEGMTSSELARNLGIKKDTLLAWESDRTEPRANRLLMIAGLLNVSPTWLLHGVGDAPVDMAIADEIRVLRAQVSRIQELRAQTDDAVAQIEKAIDRIAQREQIS